jgi:hypothetical protein
VDVSTDDIYARENARSVSNISTVQRGYFIDMEDASMVSGGEGANVGYGDDDSQDTEVDVVCEGNPHEEVRGDSSESPSKDATKKVGHQEEDSSIIPREAAVDVEGHTSRGYPREEVSRSFHHAQRRRCVY